MVEAEGVEDRRVEFAVAKRHSTPIPGAARFPPMQLTIPDDIAAQAGCSDEEMRFDLAVGLMLDGRLTLGQAGRLAGLSKPEFLDALGRHRIPMPYDEQDLASDLRTLDRLFPGRAS